jgi:hypothetical protein
MQFIGETKPIFAEQVVATKAEYRYQELGLQMQKDFAQNIWWLFHRYHEDDIRYAYEQCKKYQKFHVGYIISIINKRYGRSN